MAVRTRNRFPLSLIASVAVAETKLPLRVAPRVVRYLAPIVAWSVAAADPTEIDRINIHQASLRAMQRAVLALAPLPDIVLVDAFRVKGLPEKYKGMKEIAWIVRNLGGEFLVDESRQHIRPPVFSVAFSIGPARE